VPHLTGQLNRSVGPLVRLGVRQAQPFTAVGVLQALPANQIFTALIDSGASHTCVSPAVVAAVGLPVAGIVQVGSATHQGQLRNMYVADVALILPIVNWWFPNLQVIDFTPQANSPYEMLLGRDILCKGSFHMSPDGHFTFSI
jgi:hypothetical protein